MTTRESRMDIGPTTTQPGLKRQVANDLDYLMMLRTNYVKSLVPQIVVPNNAWMGQVRNKMPKPVSSTDISNSYSRQIHQSHAWRSKQLLYGN